jgi:hypothetical protein
VNASLGEESPKLPGDFSDCQTEKQRNETEMTGVERAHGSISIAGNNSPARG